MVPDEEPPPPPSFARRQAVEIVGLTERNELNGLIAEVLGPLSNRRYPVRLMRESNEATADATPKERYSGEYWSSGCSTRPEGGWAEDLAGRLTNRDPGSGECIRVLPTNLRRTDRCHQEGKVIDGYVMRYGEWFSLQTVLDRMMNDGEKAGDAFAELSAKDQADVLSGRRIVSVWQTGSLPEGCPGSEWIGSGGAKCDGCGNESARMVERNGVAVEEVDYLRVCGRCRYTACAACLADDVKGTCFCKDANFEVEYSADPAEREPHQTGKW